MEKWTEAQKKAINAKGATLVTASAGTGKTAVLTEKVVSMILNEGVTVNQLLVMTFSNAAAEEMKNRISEKLVEALKDKSVSFRKRAPLYNQIKLLHTSHIQTIHAFCYDVVKKYYYEVGLSSDIKTGDTFDIAVLERKAISSVLKEEFKNNDKYFIELLSYFDNSETVEDIFVNAYEKIYSNLNPVEWMDSAVELYNVSEDTLPEFMKAKLISDFTRALSFYEEAKDKVASSKDSKLDKAATVIDSDISIIKYVISLIESGRVDIFDSNPLGDFGATIRFPSQYVDIRDTRNKGKDIIDGYKKSGFDIKEQLRRIKHMHPIVRKFCDIIIRFDEEYSLLKQKSGIIDFHDMEKFASKILDNKSIADTYKSIFKHVFIDEYQDTSPIQEDIISKISTKNNLFCVGDQKQSIYRFRASDPKLFIDRNNAYKEKHLEGQVIALNNNFRSSKNVLNCANDVFYNISKQSNEITYQEEDALVHGRDDDGSAFPVEIELIPSSLKEEYEDFSADEIEVLNIVKLINRQLQEKIFDPDTNSYRNVRYGDIVILCRKLSGLAEHFNKILTNNNIPYIIEQSGGLLDTIEIQQIINLLSLAENPDNDIALISFIHEGFLGFTDDDLISIRKIDYSKPLIENIKTLSANDSPVGIRCYKFLNLISSVKTREKYMQLSDLVSYLFDEIKYIDFFAIQENGKQKVENIKLFTQYIYQFQETHNEKIMGFLNYVNELKNAKVLIDEAKTNYSENSVRITTIHKSKGLEFPVVIIPYMNKAFNSIDKRLNVSIERTVGIGFKYFDLEKQEKGKTYIRNLINDVIADKNREEEMRLLYVAMTRAREKLILQGTVSGSDLTNTSEAKSMMDWVISSVLYTEEDETGISDKVSGDWKSSFVAASDIEEYALAQKSAFDKDSFLSRFSVPVSKEADSTSSYFGDVYIPTAISASRIEVTPSTDTIFKRPKNHKRYNQSDIGTATHMFLKNINFNGNLSYLGLIEQKDEMVKQGILKKDVADLIDFIKLSEFFDNDDLVKLIASADEIKREINISYETTSDNLNMFSSKTRNVLVRCVIDLLIKKDNKWYIVDYKTDRIDDPNNDEELTDKIMEHRQQISLYEEAVQKNMGITVDESYLVFLNIPKSFTIFR